ncbi:MAG: S8 family serine peptidase [Methylocystaceae bacterium]|nr:S8 family serine peptidase [Methylocystaceae bacterium]
MQPQAIEGEFLVQFKTNKSLNSLATQAAPAWFQKLGKDVQVDTSLQMFNIAHVRLANPASTGKWQNLADIMSSDANVEYVSPNYMVHALGGKPNDSLVDSMWFLNRIEAFKAWDSLPNTNADDVIVAVVDTGIQYNHEDLRGHIWKNEDEIPDNQIDDDKNGYVDDVVGWNFVDNNHLPYAYLNALPVLGHDPDTGRYLCTPHPTIKIYETHGTHVAGTIAAVKNNNKGIVGIAEKVKIMPLKALGGTCGGGDTVSILKAVQYAVDNGAKVVNMSLGGYGHSPLAERMYKALTDRGVLIVAAAGNNANDNDGRHRSYPASYPSDGILSVAASNESDELARFSNFGKRYVDLASPGVNIVSTIPAGHDPIPRNEYKASQGTSMAAPIVSGTAALLLAQNPSLTNLELKARLMASVDKSPAFRDKVASGGRLNIFKALNQRHVIVQKPDRNEKSPIPTARHEDSVGGIRIFDHREDRQKW